MSGLDVGSLICEKNNQFIAFNKPAGIALQSRDGADFVKIANAYAKRTLFPVHRIDQPVSGLILMARNKNAAAFLSTQFKSAAAERIYHAIVDVKPDLIEGELEHYLLHDKRSNKVRVVDQSVDGAKLSKISYHYLASSDLYHLLRIKLYSGRTHQIRAQLAFAGMHIKGDVKYGARRANKDRSIHLHATSLKIIHPVTREEMTITAPWPDEVLWNFFASLQKGMTPDKSD